MNSRPRRQYTSEFKAQAVELLDTGRPVAEIAEELWISTSLLYSWKRAQVGSEGPRAGGERAAADDLRAMRRELVRLRQENDI